MCNCFNIISSPDQFIETHNHKKRGNGAEHLLKSYLLSLREWDEEFQYKESRGNTLNSGHDILLL